MAKDPYNHSADPASTAVPAPAAATRHDEEYSTDPDEINYNLLPADEEPGTVEIDPANHPYSRLTPDAVLNAIESLDYHCDGRILALNSYENRVYQVGIEDQQPIIAKFYRPGRWSEAQLREEQSFSFELADAEWPIVPPLRDHSGTSLHLDQGFHFALFERKGGHAPELGNEDNLEVLGRSLGRLHALGAERPFIHRPGIDVQTYAVDSRDFLLNHDFIPADMRAAYQSVADDLIERLQTLFNKVSYASIRLHGDCHPGNILWRNDAPLFVDFDDCRSGPAVQDLWMLLSGDRTQQQIQLDALLDGYGQFYDFNPAELRLIEGLRTLRLMHYAAWLARRWEDPAFPHTFSWFNTPRYWGEHIMSLREQQSSLQEPPLQLISGNG